jgi:hypothetical protein
MGVASIGRVVMGREDIRIEIAFMGRFVMGQVVLEFKTVTGLPM